MCAKVAQSTPLSYPPQTKLAYTAFLQSLTALYFHKNISLVHLPEDYQKEKDER
jgi:hypothetical protein